MTFETLDWIAEAERVRLAFDVKGDCEFIVGSDEFTMDLMQTQHHRIALNHSDQLFLYCYYHKGEGRTYCIFSVEENMPAIETRITFFWENDRLYPVVENDDFTHADTLAKGIFYLGLLSLEAEEDLRINVSAHQKLEWSLEYQRRVGQG